jgi:peptidyl-tRNA hydrolase, PTH1 family
VCPEDAVKKIVVGLGNPGSRYEKTRHNIGWMVLDRLAERMGSVGRAKARDGAASVRGRIGQEELIPVKPTTYMNLSGEAVRKVLARERAPLRDVLVVVDDMALPFGRLRLRERGSAGGHNGLRSIIGEMGSEAFARLRVGIGAPGKGAVEHVLGDFAHVEQRHLDTILDAAADAVEMWAREGAHRAANRWNAWQMELPAGATPGLAGDRAGLAGAAPSPAGVRASTDNEDPRGAQVPDAEGIVRNSTGWRRLLPDILVGRARDKTR